MKEKTNHIQLYSKWLIGLFVLLLLMPGCDQSNENRPEAMPQEVPEPTVATPPIINPQTPVATPTESPKNTGSSLDNKSMTHTDSETGGIIEVGGSGGAIPDSVVAAPAAIIAPEAPVAAPIEIPQKVESKAPPTRALGNILYNPPKSMTLHTTERIEVRIGHEELSTKGLVGKGEVIRDELPISEYMTVRLCCGSPSEDHPFDIVALNQERQIVDRTGYTQWAFNVTPRKSGQQYLDLSVSAHYTYPNGEIRTKDSPVKTDQILINVDTKQETQNWLVNNWKWLSILLLIPLLVFYVMRNLKAKKRKVSRSGNESVFISYRRNDSSGYTLAIYEQLKKTFEDDHVFMDMDDIPHGEDFVEHIEKVLSSANTMLVMIGENWLNAENANGRRLDDPNDFVRLEVATALKRKVRVIPVLLKDTDMPSVEDLPENLQMLARRNAIRIHDDQFDASVQLLIQAIDEAS